MIHTSVLKIDFLQKHLNLFNYILFTTETSLWRKYLLFSCGVYNVSNVILLDGGHFTADNEMIPKSSFFFN